MNRAQRRQAARHSRKARRPHAPLRAVAAGAAAPGAAAGAGAVRDMEAAAARHRAGDVAGAAQLYQRVLAADPDHADALHYLGLCAADMGQVEAALGLIDRSIALHPKCAVYHNNRGNVLKNAGRADAAEDAYRRAVALDARFAGAWNNLGITLAAQGRFDEAARAFRRAVRAEPGHAEAHNNLANALHVAGRFNDAEAAYRRAVAADPRYYMAWNNLANTLATLGRTEDAIAACRRAVDIAPDYAGGHNTLASLLQAAGAFGEADAAFRRALALDPKSAAAWNNFGNALKDRGAQDEAIAAFRRALEIDPGHAMAHSNLLLCMGMEADCTAREILAESRRWDEMHAARAPQAGPHGNDRDPERRLRIGYVSPDFRDHAVSHFVEPLFAAHDRAAVEVFAYAHVAAPDAATERIRRAVDRWCVTVGMSHGSLARRIRADGIDILVDLAGHTACNRLLAFAERPAPVQATWLGYGGTTGLAAMDYRLTDAVADPPGAADAVHSETLVRLPDAFLCYAPPADAPAPGALPSGGGSGVTFASFNNLGKVTPQAVACWARVLAAVPGARMIVKGRPFADGDVRRRHLDLFAAAGVDPGRVELLAQLPSRRAYLDTYERVDVVLDTFPYSGATTTCEALWMGVPVITRTGDRHVSRMSASILACMGADDLVAASEDDFVDIAVRLAGDGDRLGALRAGLRPRMAASPLCDAPRFARAMEAAYRDMWRRWCAGGGHG